MKSNLLARTKNSVRSASKCCGMVLVVLYGRGAKRMSTLITEGERAGARSRVMTCGALECRSDLCTTCSSDERYDGAL